VSLQEALAQLGIRQVQDGVIAPPDIYDVIEGHVFECYPFVADHRIKPLPAAVIGLVDLHSDLSMLLLRIQHTLSMHGHAILRTIKPPQVASGATTLGGAQIKEECKHLLVDVDATRSELVCRTCDTRVNPMWWLARYTAEIQRASQARESLRKQSESLRAEVEALKKEREKHRAAMRRATKKKDG
jgi:hypothetical protein